MLICRWNSRRSQNQERRRRRKGAMAPGNMKSRNSLYQTMWHYSGHSAERRSECRRSRLAEAWQDCAWITVHPEVVQRIYKGNARFTIRSLKIRGWDECHRSGNRAGGDLEAARTPLLLAAAKQLPPGKA